MPLEWQTTPGTSHDLEWKASGGTFQDKSGQWLIERQDDSTKLPQRGDACLLWDCFSARGRMRGTLGECLDFAARNTRVPSWRRTKQPPSPESSRTMKHFRVSFGECGDADYQVFWISAEKEAEIRHLVPEVAVVPLLHTTDVQDVRYMQLFEGELTGHAETIKALFSKTTPRVKPCCQNCEPNTNLD